MEKDYTSIYINGRLDEKAVWQDKIKRKIEELKEMPLECETFSSMRNYGVLILEEMLGGKQ